MSNPLLEPIHGVSLQDYAAVSAKMAAGEDLNSLLEMLGVEQAIYEEASELWNSRMAEDDSFTVTTEFGNYFAQANDHPKLQNANGGASNADNNEYLNRFKTDRLFFEELNGARQAAYEYGLDGAQWIQDNFGINLADFQAVSMHWMNVNNQEMEDSENRSVQEYFLYRNEKQKEYAEKFAAEQGGNIADDVEF